MLDHKAFPDFLDQLVKDHLGDSNALLFDQPISSDSSRCRTAVLAATSSSLDAPPYIFRTYSATPEFKITDVARATSATAGVFAPVSLSYPPMQFIDAGSACYNNPAEIALDEAHKLWPERSVDLLLSIGTGSQRIVDASQDKLFELSQRLMSSCEAVHERVCRRLAPTAYFRLSVPQGLEDIGGKAWAESGLPGRVAEITSAYLRKAEPSRNLSSFVQSIVGMQGTRPQTIRTDSVVLTIKNLIPKKLSFGLASETQVCIATSATQKDVAKAVVKAGYRKPKKFVPDKVFTAAFRSNTTVPVYDVSLPQGLTIIPSQTPMDWFIGYLEFHRVKHPLVPDNQCTEATLSGNEIELPDGDGTISIHRTLRVPDDGKIYSLPPNLVEFPLLPVEPFAKNLPESVTRRGGFILPMYQREALWIRLPRGFLDWEFPHDITSDGDCPNGAFKIAVGGINAVSGLPHDSIAELSGGASQDYLSGKIQPWLDGIATEPGVIKQFVAMPLGQGYTIEEQLLGSTKGGIQIDFYPRLERYVAFHSVSSSGKSGRRLAFHEPISMQLEDGNVIKIILRQLTEREPWRTVAEHLMHAGPVPLVAHYMDIVSKAHRKCAKSLTTQSNSSSTPILGLGAGGSIRQRIYADKLENFESYAQHPLHRIFVHVVSTTTWELATGTLPPPTSIRRLSYEKEKIPWFSIYDEHIPGIPQGGKFENVQTVDEIDGARGILAKPRELNANSPPNCDLCNNQVASVVFRPCTHCVCGECLTKTVSSGSTCLTCSNRVFGYIGFKKPAKYCISTKSDKDFDITNTFIDAPSRTSTTLELLHFISRRMNLLASTSERRFGPGGDSLQSH